MPHGDAFVPGRPEGELGSGAATHRLATLAAVLAAVVLTGCARGGVSRPVAPMGIDTLWYVSARARDDRGRDTRRLADSLEYGIVVTTVDARGDPLSDALGLAHVDSMRLTRVAFTDGLRRRSHASGNDGRAVLIVHGFGTSLHEAWSYAVESRVRARSAAPWIAFSWPSNGAGVAWPRGGEVLVRAYREDSASAVASRPAFAEATGVVLESVGARQLVLLAHSMGSQLVAETLVRDTTLRTSLARVPLRALAFVAPDVATDRFRDTLAPALRSLAERVVVYGSSNDRMLLLSRSVNDTERAGLFRDTSEAFAGVETVDLTEGLTSENAAQRVVGTHHAIRRESAALFDLHLVANHHPPACRAILGTALLGPRGIWRLTAAPLPPLSALSRCVQEGGR